MFAATYGLAATLFAHHPAQVVITGPANDRTAAHALESAANSVFRFGKSVLRILPGVRPASLPLALRESLPHLPKDQSLALVCSGNSCSAAHQRSASTENIIGRRAKLRRRSLAHKTKSREKGLARIPSANSFPGSRSYFFGRDSGGTIPFAR